MTISDIRVRINEGFYNKDGASFYEDLVETFELDPLNKITSKMYSLAWQNGHAYGYHEVLAHFQDLVEVFKDE